MSGSIYLPIHDHQIVHGNRNNSNWLWLVATLLVALMLLFLSSLFISARNNTNATQSVQTAEEYKGSPINLQ